MVNKYENVMARIKGGNSLTGKVGNLVYTKWKGIEVVRMNAVRSKSSWTDKQKLHRQRFRAINEYCGKNQYLIHTIWNMAAENGHGYNLFLKANTPAFAQDGELAFTDKLHFSAGKIPLPQVFTAKRSESDPSKVQVNWTDEAYFAYLHSHDELMMVCAYPDRFTTPIATGALRKRSEALVNLPADAESITGIWLFFRANKEEGYSGDQYFGL
jgi:hypothetical protein